MKKYLFLSALVCASVFASVSAQTSYYSSIEGVKGGQTIKDALYNLIKNVNTVSYGTGANSTWGAFYTTDVVIGTTDVVADMYSPEVRHFGTKGAAVDGMNIEHSVAKSWWGGTQNNAYRDLHHLNPSDATANSRKSNYPMGELTSVSWTNGVMNVGKADIAGVSQNAFEPSDEYKGDFARTYMYMFTCYQNLTWTYTWMVYEKSTYPTVKPWAVDLLLKWHRQDPVSEKEIVRNNAVYAIQGNRNPYVDYPRLADFVWGDSVNYEFHLYGAPEDGSGNQGGADGDSGSTDGAGGTGGTDGSGTGGDAERPSSDRYELLLSPDALAAGDTIIIVYGNYAMSTTQNSNNRGVASVQAADGVVVSLSDDVQRIVIGNGVSAGTYSFHVGNGYLYAASSSSNHLRTKVALDANASWAIEIDSDGAATITACGDKTRNVLQYNSSASLFSCYKSGQKTPGIYVKAAAMSAVTGVGEATRIVDVYNVSGICVRRGVPQDDAVRGLPPGMYVVGKRKYVVR